MVHIKQEPSYFVDNQEQKDVDMDQTETQNELTAANMKIDELKSTISALKIKKEEQFQNFESELRKADIATKECKNKFDVISEEKNYLQKRIHELESQLISDTKPSKRRKKDEYEVQTLLKNKRTNGQMRYLIHWKHFDSSHDSWEQEANLNCQTLLDRYKRENNNNLI